MNTRDNSELVTVDGLLAAGIFPPDAVPDRRTLLGWARTRRIPSVKLGRYVLFSPDRVRAHIATRLTREPAGVG